MTRSSQGGGTDSRRSQWLSALPRAFHVVAHILSPTRPEGRSARISYFAEHQARENTRPKGSCERTY